MSDVIRIDRYEPRLEKGSIKWYAIKGKTEYLMPDAYTEMYNEDYLAITQRSVERPALLDLADSEATHYVPLRTAGV